MNNQPNSNRRGVSPIYFSKTPIGMEDEEGGDDKKGENTISIVISGGMGGGLVVVFSRETQSCSGI